MVGLHSLRLVGPTLRFVDHAIPFLIMASIGRAALAASANRSNLGNPINNLTPGNGPISP